jgi:hypothetical protein
MGGGRKGNGQSEPKLTFVSKLPKARFIQYTVLAFTKSVVQITVSDVRCLHRQA